MKFPFYSQYDQMDCGPTCLRMIAKFYGRNIKIDTLRTHANLNKEGVSLLGLIQAAEHIGLRAIAAKIKIKRLEEAELPCILHWQQNHFVVLYRIEKNKYFIADPALGLLKLNESDFKSRWIYTHDNLESGLVMLINPTHRFNEDIEESNTTVHWSYLVNYFVLYKKLFFQLIVALIITSVFQLLVPILTQSIVDIGISSKNIGFITLILLAQFMIILGRVSVEFIRSWILLHISTRVNISILTDFLIKLMNLPISFFDTRKTGDILQRINDQKKIEAFLTGSTLSTIFSLVNVFVFSLLLAFYNGKILAVFLSSGIMYSVWIYLFLNRRRTVNYQTFDLAARNQSAVVQLINGIQEIKLANSEVQKRWNWEEIQAKLFKVNIKSLALSQYQQGGATLINECSNLIITFLSATAVVKGHLTLGGMLAIQYIVGQLNSPFQQFLTFTQGYQDAKISLERLNQIHEIPDEDSNSTIEEIDFSQVFDIQLKNVTFRYPGAGNEAVLDNINIFIQKGKTTAIVGMSGSGKTTLIKLLLQFYQPEKGEILIGNKRLSNVNRKTWRRHCGIVLQEGFIFSDTIEQNIAVGVSRPDKIMLEKALMIANLVDFIESLPLGLKTKIGIEGNGISQGQKQRILIARAVYKDPEIILFDEATNALDSNNEKIIVENLNGFLTNRTVVVVAHRLSTVSKADNIIVLNQGKVIEQGTHSVLSNLKGSYYQLVKNQLELGN